MKPVWIKKGNGYVRIPYGILTELADGTYRIILPSKRYEEVRKYSLHRITLEFLEEHQEHFELVGHYLNSEVWKPKGCK